MKKKEVQVEEVETPVETPVEEPVETPADPAQAEAETKELLSNIEKLVDSKVAAMKAELDTPTVKNINVKTVVTAAADRMPKEERFKSFVINVMNQDFAALKAAGNTTDLGAVVPPGEFEAEVQRLEEDYGVAVRDCEVKRTDKTSMEVPLGDDDLQVSIVGEAQVKPSKKLAYTPWIMTFRKGVGILPLTDEVLEDSAVNLWADATKRFARAYARKEDEFVFTDATSGIINQPGVNEVPVANVNAIDFDTLNLAMYGVPSPSMASGKWYFHRTLLGYYQRIKDTDGKYVLIPGPNGPVTGTLWGRPYELTEVMPSLQDLGSDDVATIFGSLQYVRLGYRTNMTITMSNQGVVADPDGGDDLNLFTQDLTAMRAVRRFNAKVKFAEAFSVIRVTSPVS
jgi:HK97 family phage major capsid protein